MPNPLQSVSRRHPRRAIVRAAVALPLAAAIAWGLPPAALAQSNWPAKPIRLMVGFAAGGGIDFTARVIQPGLQEALKQQLIVDYKPGAGGVLAASELVRSAPDGYTFLVANTGPFAIAPYLQSKRPYDPKKDFTYVGQIAEGSYIAVTKADHPAKDLREFVAWAKGQKGGANFASSGPGTSTHLNGELLNQVTGAGMIHVPYKGSAPALQDLIGGQTHLLVDAGTALLPQIRGGKLKALAVTSPRRDPNLPDVPTARELGLAGVETLGFQGLVAPPGLPADIVKRMAAELAKVLGTAEVKSRFASVGSEVRVRGPEEFQAYVAAENDKWAEVIRRGGIRLD